MKKICVHLFFSVILVTQSLFSSDNEFTNMPTGTSRIPEDIRIDESLAQLAQQLQPLNDVKIANYQWEDANDYIYTEEPINRPKRMLIRTIMQQLLASRNSDKRLSTIVRPQDELTIQEGFFNILLNSRCAEDEAAKSWYNLAFGPGEFHKKYGNYKKTIQFNPAHKFAKTVWHTESINPHNLSIDNLARISQMAMDTTADEWLKLKPIIDEKILNPQDELNEDR